MRCLSHCDMFFGGRHIAAIWHPLRRTLVLLVPVLARTENLHAVVTGTGFIITIKFDDCVEAFFK